MDDPECRMWLAWESSVYSLRSHFFLFEQLLGMEEEHPYLVTTLDSGFPKMLRCMPVSMKWLLLKAQTNRVLKTVPKELSQKANMNSL